MLSYSSVGDVIVGPDNQWGWNSMRSNIPKNIISNTLHICKPKEGNTLLKKETKLSSDWHLWQSGEGDIRATQSYKVKP